MIPSSLLALFLAGLAGQEPATAPTQEVPGESELPGPRVKIAGQHAVHAVSRIAFASAPGDPHELTTTLAFPARLRTELTRAGGRTSERSVAYRYGTQLWALAPDSDESRSIAGAEGEFVAFEFALRRALLLWPHGHEWSTPEPGTRCAKVALSPGVATILAVGLAVGEPDGDELPNRLILLDHEGAERLRFEALTWTREQKRWRPHTLRFLIGEELVWTEEFRRVDRSARFVDAWFLPPDRRETPGEGVDRAVRSLDRRPGLVRRVPFTEALDLDEALDRAGQLAAETVPPPGHRLSPDLCVELDAGGVPHAASLWMEPWSETPPTGWEAFSGGPALGLWLPDGESVPRQALAQLLRHAGPAAGETPRLLLRIARREDGTRRARLVLPLQDSER